MTNEPTIKDVLDSINEFATDIQEDSNKRFTRLESIIVTKDYLDEKLADLRGDLVVLVRKEDTKVNAMLKKLKDKKIFSDTDIDDILKMEPFAKIAL